MTTTVTRDRTADGAVLRFDGPLDLPATAALWGEALVAARGSGKLVLDVTRVPHCDTAGATLLAVAEAAAGGAEIIGANGEIIALLDQVRSARLVSAPPAERAAADPLRGVARATVNGVAFWARWWWPRCGRRRDGG